MQIRWQHKYERSPGKWIFVPSEESKNEGLRIKDVIEKRWQPPEYYFHLRSGGHVAALRSHAASRIFLRQNQIRIRRMHVSLLLEQIFGKFQIFEIKNKN